MVNKARQKGYRTVSTGRKILEAQGYIFANLEKSGRFIKDKDLFSLWDALFIKNKIHLFIQFKTGKKILLNNKNLATWTTPFLIFGKKHGSKLVKYQIWNKRMYRGFEVLECDKNRKVYIVKI